MSTGSEREPADAATQMSAATQRLRDQAWMMAPLTTALGSDSSPAAEHADSGSRGER